MSKAPEPIDGDAWPTKIAEKFGTRSDYLIPILQYVQGETGWLSPAAMTAVARHLRLPPSKVYGVASFYTQFHFKPQGRNKLTVCRGTACHVRGSARIESELSDHLKVPPGGTTGDQLFTLESVACVGACALAPVVVINGEVFADQSVASVKKSVDKLRKQDGGGSAGVVQADDHPSQETAG